MMSTKIHRNLRRLWVVETIRPLPRLGGALGWSVAWRGRSLLHGVVMLVRQTHADPSARLRSYDADRTILHVSGDTYKEALKMTRLTINCRRDPESRRLSRFHPPVLSENMGDEKWTTRVLAVVALFMFFAWIFAALYFVVEIR